MSIVVTCTCGSQQRLPNSYGGKDVKCTKCGSMVRVGSTLIERRLKAGDVTLVAQCESTQEQQADAVLRKVAAHTGVGLVDKAKIFLGWSMLQLQKRGPDLFVCEADYLRNPWSDVKEDITVVIQVGWAQANLARKLSVKPIPCTFSQSIQIAAGCFSESELLMRRIKSPKGEDSGWFIGPVDPMRLSVVHEKGDYETILSYQLLSLRPGMLAALILPLEFRAHYRDNDLISVTAGDDQELHV